MVASRRSSPPPPAPAPLIPSEHPLRLPSNQEHTYSLDIDPTGTRLVTSSVSAVRVWSLRPALDERAELEGDAAHPRLLATLRDHQAPINAARFSHEGTRIASGSDDQCLIIYELRAGPGAAAFGGGSSGAQQHENWRPVQMLRGHGSNVTDLAWSHDDKLIATASIDSTLIVWDVSERPFKQEKQITGHMGHVKGVAWDPLGRYLASQGDDGVRVWSRDGWQQVVHLAAEFKYASKQVFHLK